MAARRDATAARRAVEAVEGGVAGSSLSGSDQYQRRRGQQAERGRPGGVATTKPARCRAAAGAGPRRVSRQAPTSVNAAFVAGHGPPRQGRAVRADGAAGQDPAARAGARRRPSRGRRRAWRAATGMPSSVIARPAASERPVTRTRERDDPGGEAGDQVERVAGDGGRAAAGTAPRGRGSGRRRGWGAGRWPWRSWSSRDGAAHQPATPPVGPPENPSQRIPCRRGHRRRHRPSPERERYEAHADGELAGFRSTAGARPGRARPHRDRCRAFEGQGLGGALRASRWTTPRPAAPRSSRSARSSTATSSATPSTPTSSRRPSARSSGCEILGAPGPASARPPSRSRRRSARAARA